jgi:capsular polysaccharide biosynthesis protein
MPRLLVLGERGEQNPYHLLFCMIPQFKGFDDGVHTVYYRYPYSHPQPLRDAALKALPPRFQVQEDLSGFEIFVESQEPVAGVQPTDSWVYSYVRDLYSHIQQRPRVKKAIYISRRHARCRRVLNEDDLLDGLAQRGIEVVCLEYVSFEDSICLFRDATLIVGPHGAGLSFSVFSNPGSVLLEINTSGSSESHFSTLAGECGLKYLRYMDVEKKDDSYLVNTSSFFEAIDETMAYLNTTS